MSVIVAFIINTTPYITPIISPLCCFALTKKKARKSARKKSRVKDNNGGRAADCLKIIPWAGVEQKLETLETSVHGDAVDDLVERQQQTETH